MKAVRGWLWFLLALTMTLAVYTIISQQAEMVRYKTYGNKLGEAYMDQQGRWLECERQRFIDTQTSL